MILFILKAHTTILHCYADAVYSCSTDNKTIYYKGPLTCLFRIFPTRSTNLAISLPKILRLGRNYVIVHFPEYLKGNYRVDAEKREVLRCLISTCTKKKKIKNKKVAGGSMEGMEGLNVFKRRIHKILQPQYKSINVGQWEVKG